MTLSLSLLVKSGPGEKSLSSLSKVIQSIQFVVAKHARCKPAAAHVDERFETTHVWTSHTLTLYKKDAVLEVVIQLGQGALTFCCPCSCPRNHSMGDTRLYHQRKLSRAPVQVGQLDDSQSCP